MLFSIKNLARTSALAIALTAPFMVAAPEPALAQISIGVNINIAPPELPVYAQPALPAPGYLWQPGYWAWDPDVADYFWVPGAWILPPRVGLLWTPGYWGWNDGVYVFNNGYWGRTVGFYGGISYGFGYTGSGFFGGQWVDNQYSYNKAVTNVANTNITNVYNKTVVVNNVKNVSYNGGAGGVIARPTPAEEAAAHEPHVPPTVAQVEHAQTARKTPALRFSTNHGKPAIAAVAKPVTTAAPVEPGKEKEKEKVEEKQKVEGKEKVEGKVKEKETKPKPVEKVDHASPETPREAKAKPPNVKREKATEGHAAVHPKVEKPVEHPRVQPEKPHPVHPRVEAAKPRPAPVRQVAHVAPRPPAPRRPPPPHPQPHPAPCKGPHCK